MRKVDVLIVGGGFYGSCIALFFKSYYDNVVIVEKEADILTRASAINQARVHTGFHYPRSFLTAYRSLINFPRFALDFRKAIVGDFTKVYAIARQGSKVNARRFNDMFQQMGAKIKEAPPAIQKLFNPQLIEGTFVVEEMAFDAAILRRIMSEKLERAGVPILFNTEVERVAPLAGGRVAVTLAGGETVDAGTVFNCTYSRINVLLKNSGLELLPMKHELTEMALVEVPPALSTVGITVMDGPFFSTMPYPAQQAYSLSHVRYTPHHQWIDQEVFLDGHRHMVENVPPSNYPHMIRDAARYLPALSEAKFIKSLFEIKTVLLQNESDDGRPILFRRNHGLDNFATVMGGKIDNIYDILEMIGETKRSMGLHKNPWKHLFEERPAPV